MSTALETSVSASETAQLARFAAALDAPLVAADDALWATLTPVQGLGRQFLRASSLLPVLHEAEPARVLSAAPVNFAALDALTQFLGVPVTIALCAREPLLAAIERVYRDQDATGAGLSLGGFDGDGGDGSGAGDDDLETLKALAEDAPVVRLVQTLLSRAVEARASDVHLEISQQRFRVRYRIDGVLFDMESPPRRLYLPAISHLKLRARMNIAERRLPQDGRLKMELGGRHIDMRVSTVPTVYGESMVIRLLDQGLASST